MRYEVRDIEVRGTRYRGTKHVRYQYRVIPDTRYVRYQYRVISDTRYVKYQYCEEYSNYLNYMFCLISRAVKYKPERKSGNIVYRCFVEIIPYYLRVPIGSGFLFTLSGT